MSKINLLAVIAAMCVINVIIGVNYHEWASVNEIRYGLIAFTIVWAWNIINTCMFAINVYLVYTDKE